MSALPSDFDLADLCHLWDVCNPPSRPIFLLHMERILEEKRFINLRTLKTLRIIFTVMAQQAEIGRAQKFLGFRSRA